MESALCKRLAALQPSDKYSLPSPVIPSIIVVANSETPFAAKNALQDLQRHRILYHSPSTSVSTLSHTDAEQRATCIQQLLSQYDNCLSEYAIHRLHIHSVAFSIRQLRTLFAHAYLFMLVCKYQSIPAEALDVADVTKQQLYSSLVQFVTERMSGATYGCGGVLTCSPVVPSIPDSVVLALLEKEKPSYSVVDVTRTADWCRALGRSDEEMRDLDGMIKELRERDERIRKEDMANRESREPVERRRGEVYVMKEVAAEDATVEAPKEQEEAKRGGLMSPKFSRMMEAESLNTSGSGYKADMERRAKEEAERVKLNEKKNMEERERMRQEEEKRQRDDEERRKAEFEAQKRKEEERQRRIEAKLAAQEAERNRKIEEQRKKQEEAARRRQEELERREEEKRKREQEELEQKEREREALVEKRRQRMQEEILKKERQNQKEAAEQMKRFEEERRRIYEISMGFDTAKYNASTARLDEQKTAEQLAREADQKKREEAVKKAREQMQAKLQQEKEQKELEKKTYQRLAELRRPAPETSEEKRQRIEEAKRTVTRSKEQLKALLELKDQVKAIVMMRRKKEEEERKKREEEERKRREKEERKRKEEEEIARKKKEAEEEAARKKREEEAERRRIEAEKRKQELEKEKEETRKKKAEKAKKMEERLLEDELMLLDCREKLLSLKKLLKEVKAGKWCVSWNKREKNRVHYARIALILCLSSSFVSLVASITSFVSFRTKRQHRSGSSMPFSFTSYGSPAASSRLLTPSKALSPFSITTTRGPSTSSFAPFSNRLVPSVMSMGRLTENCYVSDNSLALTRSNIDTNVFASHAMGMRSWCFQPSIMCVSFTSVIVSFSVNTFSVNASFCFNASSTTSIAGHSTNSHALWRR